MIKFRKDEFERLVIVNLGVSSMVKNVFSFKILDEKALWKVMELTKISSILKDFVKCIL